MRISKLNITKSDPANRGILPIDLTNKNLGSTVALVGVNGSGKSRILNIIEHYCETLSIKNLRDKYLSCLNPIVEELLVEIEIGENLLFFYGASRKYIKVVNTSMFLQDKGSMKFDTLLKNKLNALDFNIVLNEFNTISIASFIDFFKENTMIIARSDVARAMDGESYTELPEVSLARDVVSKINYFINAFLGKRFSYKANVGNGTYSTNVHFDDLIYNWENLSPGQKILLRYAILFFAYDMSSNIDIRECIIIIDEPETHLHPFYQLKLIDAITELVKEKGQLWIATHSVHILAHIGFENVLKVDNNTIFPPSRLNHGVLFNRLLEEEESYIEELKSFVSSINLWHYCSFIKECFEAPNVIPETLASDPQYKLLIEKLIESKTSDILDFGSGKGRMGHTLKEDDNFAQIKYSAFDIDQSNLKYIIDSKITDSVYSSLVEIPDSKFDFVIICNVLHEIDPTYWIENFIHIKRMLKEDGFLLIMEDLELMRGETAHDFGYIVLGVEELKVLFQTENFYVIQPKIEDNNYQRLFLAALGKNEISATIDSQILAIKKLNSNVFSKIKEMRKKKNVNEIEARLYAHYAQLYINTQLFINERH